MANIIFRPEFGKRPEEREELDKVEREVQMRQTGESPIYVSPEMEELREKVQHYDSLTKVSPRSARELY